MYKAYLLWNNMWNSFFGKISNLNRIFRQGHHNNFFAIFMRKKNEKKNYRSTSKKKLILLFLKIFSCWISVFYNDYMYFQVQL